MLDSLTVELVIEDLRWDFSGFDELVNSSIRAAIEADGQLSVGDVAVLACDDMRIAELNGRFRGLPEPTNVLAWPSATSPNANHLGDIALAWESCQKEAKSMHIALCNHASHLLVHGCLHLLGHKHDHEADTASMQLAEIKALASMGIGNPYESFDRTDSR